MSPGTVTLCIPMKSYLRKYLQKKYGDTHVVSRRSWLGRYFIDLLDKQYRKTKVDFEKEDYYQVIVPASIVKEVGFDLSNTKVKSLGDMIHKVFINDLYSYIEVSVGSKLSFKNEQFESYNKQNVFQAIIQFLDYYDIGDDEIKVESLYRNYSREQESDSKKKYKSA
jgi:hypothetical protein